MARGRLALILVSLASLSAPLRAQYQPPNQMISIQSPQAFTWEDGSAHVVQLEGGVKVELDNTSMTARSAVIWISPQRDSTLETHQVEISLIGDARLSDHGVVRSGPVLFVTATVQGSVRLLSDQRLTRNLEQSDLYISATKVRDAAQHGPTPALPAPTSHKPLTTQPASAPTDRPAGGMIRSGATEPVQFRFPGTLQTTQTRDGRLAVLISGGVTLYQRGKDGDFLELQADRAVLFTSLKRPTDAMDGQAKQSMEKSITAAYLEGDVRIVYTPTSAALGESRLEADRAYYDFTTDRAILTDAVLHTTDVRQQIPIILRAQSIRQLALGDTRRAYDADHLVLTTSAFATPSYAVAADRAYLRQNELPGEGNVTRFGAHDATMQTFGIPIFWLPVVGGTLRDNGVPLRSLQVENSTRFGTGVRTRWGLFESAGTAPPPGLDMAYRLDYLGDRGPAVGLDARYQGGFITETTRDPWNFAGGFTSYLIHDRGVDDLPAERADVIPPEQWRGRVLWQHQHFFPENWQVQMRGGYVSDATFLEEYFQDSFYANQPHSLSLYAKRQRDTEALTFLLDYQPNDFVTNVDYIQEQFEIDRLPEIGYHRIGDSFLDDRLTFFSNNTLAGLKYSRSDATLAQQGYLGTLDPGLPSVGWTGTTENYVARGDFRQQVSFPFSVGQLRLVPYVVGRYTGYSDSPSGNVENRAFAGLGMRVSTAFWAVDDNVVSRLFDLHRMRHVVEPELHLFTGAQSVDRGELYIYDQDVDAINDLSAISFILHQRWQTQRGGPGRWRSVDVLSLNVGANYFANRPPDSQMQPLSFRGLYFPSMPEASVPRQSINADATWRISDTTALLSDAQYNWEKRELATASLGLAVSRDPRMTYFIGQRYIEELKSNILSASISYDLSTKYTLMLGQSFDFGQQESVTTTATVVRRFDRFMVAVRVFYDAREDESGITFNLMPLGLGEAVGTDVFRPTP